MTPTFHPLSVVTRRIAELLEPALASTFWVRAEISSARERGGSFFCELVETGADGAVVAHMRCTIWARDLARIRQRFAAAGLPLTLASGTRVGMQCRLQFHSRYGLSLACLDMDPTFVLGENALRRRQLLEQLERAGLLERNAALPEPRLPNRIGLVTSRDSAAFHDFVHTLETSGFGFRIYFADVTVQGPDATAQITAALSALEQLPLDLLVLVRGGGSQVDLAVLDDEALARRVAHCPLPLWTGIGHETDFGVLDAVAARSFKTPTAVAEEIAARFRNFARELAEARQRIRAVWQWHLRTEQHRMSETALGLHQGVRKLLELKRSELRGAAAAMGSRTSQRLARERGRVERSRQTLHTLPQAALRAERHRLSTTCARFTKDARRCVVEARRRWSCLRERLRPPRAQARLARERASLAAKQKLLHACDPATRLAQGFALVYDKAGTLLRSVRGVHVGDPITTQLRDGALASAVTERTEATDGQATGRLRRKSSTA